MAQALAPAVHVPDALRPGADETLSAVAHARGEQIYECRQKAGDDHAYDWAFVAPDAGLFDDNGRKTGRHYAGFPVEIPHTTDYYLFTKK